MFRQLRIDIDTAKGTDEALGMLRRGNYDLVLSDMSRDDDATAGLTFLAQLSNLEVNYITDIAETRGSLLDGLQRSPQLITFLTGHTDLMWSVAFSPDGKTLASGSKDNTIMLWDVSFDSWKDRACP